MSKINTEDIEINNATTQKTAQTTANKLLIQIFNSDLQRKSLQDFLFKQQQISGHALAQGITSANSSYEK